MKLPLVRLGEALEEIDQEFDATITADLTELDRSIVIWMLTKCKPNLRISELRCESYKELFDKLAHLGARSKKRAGAQRALPMLKLEDGSVAKNPEQRAHRWQRHFASSDFSSIASSASASLELSDARLSVISQQRMASISKATLR